MLFLFIFYRLIALFQLAEEKPFLAKLKVVLSPALPHDLVRLKNKNGTLSLRGAVLLPLTVVPFGPCSALSWHHFEFPQSSDFFLSGL